MNPGPKYNQLMSIPLMVLVSGRGVCTSAEWSVIIVMVYSQLNSCSWRTHWSSCGPFGLWSTIRFACYSHTCDIFLKECFGYTCVEECCLKPDTILWLRAWLVYMTSKLYSHAFLVIISHYLIAQVICFYAVKKKKKSCWHSGNAYSITACPPMCHSHIIMCFFTVSGKRLIAMMFS